MGRVRIVAGLLGLALFASACSGTGGETTPTTGAGTTPTTSAGTAPATTAGQIEKPVTIEFWIPGGRGRDEGAAAVIDAFKAVQPNVTVKVTAFPFNQFFDAVQVALAGNNPPDVVLLNGISVQNLAYKGALTPLTDLFTKEDIADFSPDLVATDSWKGELYGAPWANSAIAMYYNVDYFKAAGVTVPKTLADAWTWQEYKDAVGKVITDQAAAGNKIYGMVGLNNPLQSSYFAGAMIQSNSSPGEGLWKGISDDLSTVDGYINTPEAYQALTFYQGLYNDGFAPKENVPDAFGTGVSATYYAIPPSAAGLRANFPDLKWDVMPLPYFKTPLTHTGSFAPVIPAKTKNIEAARAFVHYVVSKDGFLEWYKVSPSLPGRASVIAEVPGLQEGYQALLLEEAAKWGQPQPGGPAAAIWNKIIGVDMMTNIAMGADIKQAVASAVEQTDAQLKSFFGG